MTQITLNEGHGPRIVTDIAPYRAERAQVRSRLLAIYATYEKGTARDLVPHEPEIVELYNRLSVLDDILARWDHALAQRANILAGWTLVQALREERDA